MSAFNVHDNVTMLELAAVAARTATLTATGVDVRDFIGKGKIVAMSAPATAGTNPTLNIKVQDSANNSDFADVSGMTFTQVTGAADLIEAIPVEFNAIRRYVRIVGTIGGTDTPAFTFGVVVIGRKQIV
jgi:hypothetical protein